MRKKFAEMKNFVTSSESQMVSDMKPAASMIMPEIKEDENEDYDSEEADKGSSNRLSCPRISVKRTGQKAENAGFGVSDSSDD